ncbi:MAG: hypothetical protein HY744_11075 [Deltaproteobacteria bacterium]|nr:hypothetical protein [Deltaproteobacteria bacterium]
MRLDAGLGVLCAVALLLAGRLAQVAHLLAVAHRPCAHGGLVHVVSGPGHERIAAPSLPPDEPSLREGRSYGGGHEHCDAWAITEALPSGAGPALLSGLIEWKLLARSVGPAVARQPVPLLMLAPKTSPPTV